MISLSGSDMRMWKWTLKLMTDDQEKDAAPAVSMDVIEELRELADEDTPEFLKELLHSFLADAERHLNNMKTGLAEKDLGKVMHASHTLKSSSANLGALGLSAFCKTIEIGSRDGVWAGLDEAVTGGLAEFEKVRQEMTSLPDYD